jgi:predicted RNase H-like HicB family nuclease
MTNPSAVESSGNRAAAQESTNGVHPIAIEVTVRLQAIAIPEARGGYSIAVPALPGCYSAAETIEEIQSNVVEAAEGWLGAQHDRAKDEMIRTMTS